MNLTTNIKLTDIIDFNTLINVQEKLGKLVAIPQITTDTHGIPVGKISNFIPFCRLIRSSSKGSQKCILCDRQAGLMAMEEKQRIIYNCHTGLIDCAAPIIVNDFFLGSVLGGQVLIKGEKTRDSIDVERISRDFDISLDALKMAVEFIPLVSREELQNSVECYSFLANYIDQIGVARLVQEQKFLLEQQAKIMELKTIQAQINPHFLFNTLNAVARLAIVEDAPKTEELIYNLSDLLRYNLKNIEKFPKIRDDIDNINRYLFIQSLRYSDRISYKIDIDESIMEYRIPSMILQPIVENSIVHGLETKKEGGKVEVSGHLISEEELEITIKDNGKGIKPEVLNAIRQMDRISNQQLGIGIINTFDRLRYCFGDRCKFVIESTLQVGTSISIRIPCIQSESV
jgi:ligand-binding sensor protein